MSKKNPRVKLGYVFKHLFDSKVYYLITKTYEDEWVDFIAYDLGQSFTWTWHATVDDVKKLVLTGRWEHVRELNEDTLKQMYKVSKVK